MRRNEEINRRRGHGGGHAAMRKRFPDRTRNVGIGYELAERQRCHGAPDVGLKCRAVELKRQIEPPQPSGEVGTNLREGVGEQSVGRLARGAPPRRHERTADDRSIVAYDH
jgi:hypothetical protein